MHTTSRSFVGLALVGLLALTPLSVRPLRADTPAGDQTVPDVVGLEVPAAQALLTSAGFQFETVSVAGAPSTFVVGQDPGGLATRDPSSTVVKIMVPGLQQPTAIVPVPPAPAAQPLLPAEPPPAELPPTGELPEIPAPPAALPPVETPPAPAPAVAPAEETLVPALGSLPAEAGPDLSGPPLPNTFGLTRQEAEQKLAGYQAIMEVTLTSPDMQGRVVEQHPVPGTNLALGQSVTLIFGLANEPGPEYRQVPALEGLRPEQALERLTKAGFVATWCTVPSTSDRADLVVDTTPHRFSFLLKGETVRVRLGRRTGEILPPPATEEGPTPPPSGNLPPSGELPAPSAPAEPTPAPLPPSEPLPPAEPVPPSEPTPVPTPPTEPVPTEPVPTEPVPTEPVPTEPAPTPFLPQPTRLAPGPVTLTGPVESGSFPRAYGPTFEWLTVPNCDGYEWELEQETTAGWRQVRTEKLIGTKFRPARLDAGRYRWRVRALNGETPGAWTDQRLLFLY